MLHILHHLIELLYSSVIYRPNVGNTNLHLHTLPDTIRTRDWPYSCKEGLLQTHDTRTLTTEMLKSRVCPFNSSQMTRGSQPSRPRNAVCSGHVGPLIHRTAKEFSDNGWTSLRRIESYTVNNSELKQTNA